MNAMAYILMIAVFPLNFLWLFPADLTSGKQSEAKVAEEKQLAEKKESPKSFSKESVALPPAIQPIKKDSNNELAIPNAHASLILDVDSGTILHYNNGKEHRQIASLTKLMTAILVMERINNLEEVVTIDEEAVMVEGTKIGCPRSGYCISPRLKVGEKITAGSLLKAMLMNSANDSAIALAKHISGTQEKFAELMNEKAKEMGLSDSHFCTPSGLEIDGRESECYSSAYDIARIAAYSMKFDTLWKIFRLPNETIITSADGAYSHNIYNTDIVLNQVANSLGGKTGFTPLAGYSFLMAVADETKNNKIIAVVLDDPYRFQDIKKMVDWSFESYEWK
jgi:D-alanyl-D-alanine carboxypeptidase